MARRPRVDAPGQVHHVIIRGVDRQRIFRDRDDYEEFLGRIDRLIPELDVRCFGWVLIPNHAHFALQTGSVPLQTLMRRLGTGYAGTFNRRHGRVGHLLQDRYKSRLVESDGDLLNLIAYIHCNPVRARLVPSVEALAGFPWCGHGSLVGERPARPFESCSAALTLFGDDVRQSRAQLRARMQATMTLTEKARDQAPPQRGRREHPKEALIKLDRLVQAVCSRHGIEPADLSAGRRKKHLIRARNEVVCRATRELGLTGRAVARALGISEPTVSRALAHSTVDSPKHIQGSNHDQGSNHE